MKISVSERMSGDKLRGDPVGPRGRLIGTLLRVCRKGSDSFTLPELCLWTIALSWNNISAQTAQIAVLAWSWRNNFWIKHKLLSVKNLSVFETLHWLFFLPIPSGFWYWEGDGLLFCDYIVQLLFKIFVLDLKE